MSGPSITLSPMRLRKLVLIRAAIVTGLLAFGIVIHVVHRGHPPAFDARLATTLRIALWCAMAVALVGVVLVRARVVPAARTEGDLAARLIIAWALGEGVALFAAVQYFLTGNANLFVIGLLFMLLVLVLVPIRGRS